MENEINIAEILRDMPKGTKLYSPLFGEVKFKGFIGDRISIIHTSDDGNEYCNSFFKEGRLFSDYSESECLLFPSSEMRDWTKFFKRGDVVTDVGSGITAIFDGYANDSFTQFNTVYSYEAQDSSYNEDVIYNTTNFRKESDGNSVRFIAYLEKEFKGKYNPDTLQVEPVKPECPFKTFDKVLVRNNDQQIWKAALFSHYNTSRDDHNYVIIPSFAYNWCIPYEGNEHLLGTTDPYTEGGSE